MANREHSAGVRWAVRSLVALAGIGGALTAALGSLPAYAQDGVMGDLPPLPLPPEAVVLPSPVMSNPIMDRRSRRLDEPLVLGDLVEVVAEPDAEVRVIVGRSRLFNLKRPASRILVANPAIANVRFLDAEQASPSLLDVYGLSFGTTTITLWDEDGLTTSILIRVTIDVRDLEKRVAEIFPGADIAITQVGAQIVLDGQVPNGKMMSEILEIVKSSLVGEASSVPLSGQGQPQMARLDGITRAGYQVPAPLPEAGQGENQAPGQAPGQAGTMPMQGIPPSAFPSIPGIESPPLMPAGDAVGEEVTNPYSSSVSPRAGGGLLPPGTIVNRVKVPGPRQVLLKVKIAEINRTALRELGVNWQRITDGNIINSTVGNIGATGAQLWGIFDEGNFTLYLDALRTNRLAKILAEPNLVSLDGQPARFLSGGRFPYPVPQSATIPGGGTVVTIQFADFGAILQFIPHILDETSIRLDVEPVFSELNYASGTSVAGTTVPGINQRSARTVVQLREGQTLAIAGLLQTRTNASTTRVVGLGDLPVVGGLFSRNTIETLETELVVLVTPELVEPMEPNEVPPSPGDLVWEPNDWEFYLLGRIEGRTGHPFRATLQELDPLDIMKHHQSHRRWVVGPYGYAD